MMQSFTLKVDHLKKQFCEWGTPPCLAIEDATFSVNKGEIICIMGPSGCGKSTLLRMITGLESADAGVVAASDGTQVFSPPMAMVFQEHALFPWLSVYENVAYGLNLVVRKKSGTDLHTTVMEHLALCQVDTFADSRPYQLSGGMRQRAAIARALVVKPDILVMDEPFSSLDPRTRLELEDEILKIQKKTGTTILMVTHSPEDAVYIADRIIMLTGRPARVKEVIPVPFSRPRDIADPAFISLRLYVNRLISG